ncbi:MAG TPA: thioesterase domain-containing protein, partial [Hyphomicrobiales bacterium]|nr:thioesterase domain-containing protein [Hyphomicrobiales bacterium]
AQLQTALPEYMVPSQYLLLASLPLTPNGKLDRKALPAVEGNALQQAYEAPATALEQRLAEIWQSVLGIERIGRQDNFFALGGNSLTMAHLSSLIHKQLKRPAALSDLMRRPTLEGMANSLRQYATSDSAVNLVKLNTCEAYRSPLYCIPPGGGVGAYRTLASALEAELPVYGLDDTILMNRVLEKESLPAISAAYVACIKNLQPQGPYRLLGWSIGGILALEMARLLESGGDEVSFLGLLDARGISAADKEQVKAEAGNLGFEQKAIAELHQEAIDMIDGFELGRMKAAPTYWWARQERKKRDIENLRRYVNANLDSDARASFHEIASTHEGIVDDECFIRSLRKVLAI